MSTPKEDYRPRTRRGPPGFHMPTAHSPIQRPDPGFSESPIEPINLVIPPPPRSPAPQPPSPASFYSASSSPHSDPGYDSDSTSTVEAKAEDNDDAGFDSDDALSLPAFYQNPHASHSDETLGTIGSIGSIGTVGTMGTMDTMGAALRSLGPAQRPTIRGIRSRVASMDKNGGVVMTERRTSNVASGVVNGPRLMPKMKAKPMQAQGYALLDDSREKEKHLDVKTMTVLRPKDRRSLETPSSLSLSTNLLGLPSSQASPTTNVGSRRPLSSAVAAHKALVGGGEDVHGSLPTKVSIPASNTQPPPRPPRRVHRVPPPLVLQPPSSKNLEAQLAITPKSSTSFRFPPPPTPLSPALSFMSSMSALSTVSTIAAVMLNRPKSKQPRISEKELRRRRFLKLTKTLGDDVPPELVSVKAAAPRRSRTISFGARGKFGGSRDERGAGKRDSMVENAKGSSRMRKKRKDSFDGRRTAGARHSIAVSPLEANFPSIPEGYDRYDEPLSPISPNVLRKYPSIRRRSTSNPNGRPISETFSRTSVNPTPVLSPEPGEHEPPVVTPYFEDHPFRLVVEESSPTPAPTVPRFVDADGKAAPTQIRKVTGSGPRAATQVNEEADDGGRSSSYSMNNPWMRTSLALPLSYDTPFIEYALPCGVDRKVAEGRLGAGHHRRMSSLDAISPRRISALEPLTDDTQIQYRSSRDVGGDAADTFGGRFSAIGGLRRSNGTYLDVPQEVDGDDGEWENVENGIYRKERRQGWSGEWNQPHIQTVIEKLRQL
ncbi:hypothetical protein FA13DRAFT_507053 [Coprinellus micaceus]|uniref:Uncharacterized protein n=1 Tax=Coprinellus micaceus TaxID=71717 RepID=A0A4Y7SBK9_COPMI|nr:hypothetical protein FA13DRAFT_507053 [Coprinellus micaceus]